MTSYNGEMTFVNNEFRLQDRFSCLLESGDLSDVILYVGECPDKKKPVDKCQFEMIPAHKFLLTVRSDVFEAMFSGNWREKKEVIINDIHPIAFRAMLRFLYCDETVLNDEHLISILYSARKYNLPILAKAVANRILQILTDDNFFNLIDSTTRFELREVNQVIAKTIQFNTDWLIHRDEFPKIHRSTLTTILEQPRLSVSEAELFDACIIWAKMECEKNEILNPNPDQLRKTLGPLIYLFRISSFTLQELANGPGECEVFNQKEMLDLFFYVANKKIRPDSFVNNFSSLLKRDLIIRICINNPYSPKVFSVPRCLNSHYYNREDTRESSEWPLKCTLSFELDKEVYLVGVKLISSVLNPRFFDFAVTKNLNSKQLLVDQPKVKMEDSNGSIYLKVPIILEAKKNYNISIKVENDQKESYSVFDLKSKQFSSGNDISKKSVSFTGEGKATFFFDDFPKNVYFEKIVIV